MDPVTTPSLRTALRAGDLSLLRREERPPSALERRFLFTTHHPGPHPEIRSEHWHVGRGDVVTTGQGTGKLVGVRLDGALVIAWDETQYADRCAWLDAVALERMSRSARVYAVCRSAGYDLREAPWWIFAVVALLVLLISTITLASLPAPLGFILAWLPGLPGFAFGSVLLYSVWVSLPEILDALPALVAALVTPTGQRTS